ncbi:hypothetical protein L195_g043884, partial [Trifolium pratense]
MAMLMWLLWKNRNNNVWNNTKLSARQCGAQALYLWDEWAAVQKASANSQQQPELQQIDQWQPPTLARLKCNVDASFFDENARQDGGGAYVTTRGRFIYYVGTNLMRGRLTTIEGEGMALKEAICEVTQEAYLMLHLSDSKMVVDAIHYHVGLDTMAG